mgnify:CR=1 FL=1
MWDNIEFTTWNVPFWRWSELAAKYLDQDPQKNCPVYLCIYIYVCLRTYMYQVSINNCTEYIYIYIYTCIICTVVAQTIHWKLIYSSISVGFYMFTFLGVTKICTDFSKVPATPGNGWEPARHNPGVTIQNMRDCTTICSPGDISMYYLCVYR